MTTAAKDKPAAEPPISSVTISGTTVGALDADPLFFVAPVKDNERLMAALGGNSLGALVAPILPFLKGALVKLLLEGTIDRKISQVLSQAGHYAEAAEAEKAKAEAEKAKTEPHK